MKNAEVRIHCRPEISDKTLKALSEMIRLAAKQRGHKLTEPIDVTLCRQPKIGLIEKLDRRYE